MARMARLRFGRYVSLKALGVFLCLGTLILLYGQHMYVKKNEVPINVGLFHKPLAESGDNLIEKQNGDNLNEDQKKTPEQACVLPKLEVDDPVMKAFYKKMPKIVCKGDVNWVYVDNGTLRFSNEAKTRHGDYTCDYYPLIRGPGDYNISYGKPILKIGDGAPLVSDFFKVKCTSKKNETYENIHAGVHVNMTIKERLKDLKTPANGLELSIAFLGFDSMSRMSWLRRMPNTREYLVKELKAIEMEGYNIMGDGTPAALLPILCGKHEWELPEARRKFKGAKPVDGHPWIWKDFNKHGYVTSWADAEIEIAPFNYRMLGFEHSPADYFMRPFFLGVSQAKKKYTTDCHGSEPKHMVWFNWIKGLFQMYKNDPKFLFHFYTPLSHNDNNRITMADDDLRDLVKYLHTGGFLDNTLLVIMADHGARFAKVRGTLSGKLEERNPYVSLSFPPWFEKKYPDLIRNVKTNIHRLTTPMDLHETFLDFLKFDGAGMGDVKNRGISFFKEIPKERTCAHADVAPHWCACMAWKPVSPNDAEAKKALATAIDTINGYTFPYRSDCVELTIGNITMVSKITANDNVLKFKATTGDRGQEPIMNDKSVKNEKVIYQLTFFTEPGHGEFEVTLEHALSTNKMTVNPKAISRINKYGNDPHCVLDKNREVRQYCYCKDLLESKGKI